MIAVAYLWNSNGMATWCWETAHALLEQGEEVLLVCAAAVQLPGTPEAPILRFDLPQPARPRALGRVAYELRRLSTRPSGLLAALHKRLAQTSTPPRAYLLNCAEFQDPTVDVPQYVVGWAYPTTFAGYARKVPQYCRPQFSREFVRSSLSTLGWYRKDWRAYRQAAGVLAVSERLDRSLRASGIRSTVVHPGTAVNRFELAAPRPADRYKLLVAAADLDDHRKGIRWMLDALTNGPRRDFELTFVGQASQSLGEAAARTGIHCNMIGRVPRDSIPGIMRDHEIFLFGSCLDDWGYVLVEAMSQGMAVVAPAISPFDEIVGDAGGQYTPRDPEDFRREVYGAATPAIGSLRAAAAARAAGKFSRPAFARSLLHAVGQTSRPAPLRSGAM